MKHNKIYLNTNWNFSLSDKSINIEEIPGKIIQPNEWFDAVVPGTLHTDLLHNNIIDDPYYSDNELRLEWISKQDWIYKNEFNFNPDKSKNYNLIFEGLDTIADVFLNGKKIHTANNMFLQHKINVSKYLDNGINELTVYFHSPVNYALREEKKHGKIPVELDSYRAYIRKAQYSFGWDWGPSFPTSGIWKDVYIEEQPEAEIDYVLFDTIKITTSKAKVKVRTGINCRDNSKQKLTVELAGLTKEIKVKEPGVYEIDLNIKDPKLWWPNGEGEQNLYELKLNLLNKNDEQLDSVNKRIGIRTIELITEEKKKNTFKLRVNGKDIFAKGVNWIPADSFLNRVDKSKYSKLLAYAKSAHMNIIRVWGGGIYEQDYFYELCDEHGLLVWQDFMFACGSYPEHKEFISNVKEEVKQNVIRLQSHPSVALWCGNNENEWIWYNKQKSSYKEMPGYKIYHKVIPSILSKMDPLRPYQPSSPFGKDKDPNSFNSGNTHQWNIWSNWIDYKLVYYDKSLFVTEFGFQGPANKDTLEKVIPKENRRTHDRIFEFHNKQIEGPERVWKFLAAHLPVVSNWDDYFYLAQLNQAFALKTCLEHWRTNIRTNGSIIWQINDSWPVTSWAIIDYDLKPKLAYHFVKNIFSPQIIYFSNDSGEIKAKIQNQGKDNFKGTYKIFLINAPTGEVLEQYSDKITLKPNSTFTLGESLSNYLDDDNIIATASLFDNSGKLIHTNYYNKLPWKYYNIAAAEIKLSLINDNGVKHIVITTDKPAYFVDLFAYGVEFSKRGFFVMPGEEVYVNILNDEFNKLKPDDIKIHSLNNYLK